MSAEITADLTALSPWEVLEPNSEAELAWLRRAGDAGRALLADEGPLTGPCPGERGIDAGCSSDALGGGGEFRCLVHEAAARLELDGEAMAAARRGLLPWQERCATCGDVHHVADLDEDRRCRTHRQW